MSITACSPTVSQMLQKIEKTKNVFIFALINIDNGNEISNDKYLAKILLLMLMASKNYLD